MIDTKKGRLLVIMAKIKANEALVKALQAWDIDHLYGIPGDSIDAVVDSLRTVRDQFKFYHVRHEEVASLAAAGYTKLTGKIGVALSIGGPGLIHLLNGMYDAKMDNVPQLILSGQTNSTALGTKAFQETNLQKLCEDVAVYNHQIEKVTMCLKSLTKQFVRHMNKKVSLLLFVLTTY